MDDKMVWFLNALTTHYAALEKDETWLVALERAINELGYTLIKKNEVTVNLADVLDILTMRNILAAAGYASLTEKDYFELCKLAEATETELWRAGYYDEEETDG